MGTRFSWILYPKHRGTAPGFLCRRRCDTNNPALLPLVRAPLPQRESTTVDLNEAVVGEIAGQRQDASSRVVTRRTGLGLRVRDLDRRGQRQGGAALEVPVFVLGDDGLADDVGRSRAGEQVIVRLKPLFRQQVCGLTAKTRHGSSPYLSVTVGRLWARGGQRVRATSGNRIAPVHV